MQSSRSVAAPNARARGLRHQPAERVPPAAMKERPGPLRRPSGDRVERAVRLGHRASDLPGIAGRHGGVPARPLLEALHRPARRQPAATGLAPDTVSRTPEGLVQRRLGFEIEMLALVDIDGRPIPEKAALGAFGANNLELTVDHGPQVEAPTPAAPETANFDVPVTGGGNVHMRRFDLRVQDEARLAPAPLPPMAPAPAPDVRPDSAALLAGWRNASNRTRFARPPAANNAGLDNTEIPNIDRALSEYHELASNWLRAPAEQQILAARQAITNWLGNNVEPSRWHPINRGRYQTVRDTLVQLRLQLGMHHAFWAVANDAAPAGWQREFRTRRGGALTPWGTRHPIPGMGGGTTRRSSRSSPRPSIRRRWRATPT